MAALLAPDKQVQKQYRNRQTDKQINKQKKWIQSPIYLHSDVTPGGSVPIPKEYFSLRSDSSRNDSPRSDCPNNAGI